MASPTLKEGTYQAPPGPPRNATIDLGASFFHRMSIYWDAPSNDGGSPITGYNIEWSTDGSTWDDLIDNINDLNFNLNSVILKMSHFRCEIDVRKNSSQRLRAIIRRTESHQNFIEDVKIHETFVDRKT